MGGKRSFVSPGSLHYEVCTVDQILRHRYAEGAGGPQHRSDWQVAWPFPFQDPVTYSAIWRAASRKVVPYAIRPPASVYSRANTVGNRRLR